MLAFAVMLLTPASVPEPTYFEVVAYGKRLDVNQIDSRLSSEPFEPWLTRTLGRDATISWFSDACGEEGKGYGNVPVCITAQANLRPRGRVTISITVGDARGGLGGIPGPFGMIEGLGPREPIDARDLPQLASKIRTAQAFGDEMSRRPDVPRDEAAWIGQIQRLPAARLVPRVSGDTAFGDWIAARAGPRATVEWFLYGCGRRSDFYVDLTGNKDAWAFVEVGFEDPDVRVRTRVRVGTCRKGMWEKIAVSSVLLHDKRPGHIHIEDVSLDVLERKLKAIRTRRRAASK